jgi:RimJ/RimL family protein N-acetyltransferase
MASITSATNSLGQPIGRPVDWAPVSPPPRVALSGKYCSVEPLDALKHAANLFKAHVSDMEERNYTYLPYDKPKSEAEMAAWCEKMSTTKDPLFFAICNTKGEAIGVASYLRIDPTFGAIEVGHLNYSPLLQKTPAATEAMFLLMKNAFDLGYRRYEWKCDSLNAPSRTAAARLGFIYEGLFRNHLVYKGRNRDTTWFSITVEEWPGVKKAFEGWLDEGNFDTEGKQKKKLEDFRVVTK